MHTINIAVHREKCINKNRNNSLLSMYSDRVSASLDYAEHDAVSEVAELTVVGDRSDKTQELVI